jgi:hypothetical protein
MDMQPREFSAESASLLAQLSNMVMREIERKKAMNASLCNAALRHNRYNRHNRLLSATSGCFAFGLVQKSRKLMQSCNATAQCCRPC